jgi:hypothetical protein
MMAKKSKSGWPKTTAKSKGWPKVTEGWPKEKKASPWGKKAKKTNGTRSGSSELQDKLAKIKKAAPPPPKETLYRYLTKVYRLRRTIDTAQRKELRALAKKKGINTGDKPLRAIIDETAGAHVSTKMKWKYGTALEKAMDEKVPSKNLRQFIEDHGGINRLAKGGTPTPPKTTPPESTPPKPKGPPPMRRKPRRRRRRGGPNPFGI